ncbi:acyltransferase family protein [Streptomyces sp. NPDC048507]|uniref:acyltransferase family protein n=1 Tax=Streptomyces sp. NPDC048507 TaxID=3365560 RepID=UPI0037119597
MSLPPFPPLLGDRQRDASQSALRPPLPTPRDAATPSAAPAPRPPRLWVLDGLRIVAAVMVVCHHYMRDAFWGGDASQPFGWLGTASRYGWLGVELFFMISGFVICMSAWGRSLGSYLRSRVIRLGPAYWFCALLTGAVLTVQAKAFDTTAPTLSQILTNLTMVQTPLRVDPLDPSYWTLWAEARFYLIFAIVAWSGLTYRKVLNFCWIWTVAALLGPTSGLPLLDIVADSVYAPLFISGICFYLIRRYGPRAGEPWVLLAFSWLLMQRYLVDIVGWNTVAGDKLSWSVCLAVVTGCYAIMAAVALGWLDRITWRWLSTAGAISYPLYLLHQQIGVTLLPRLTDDLGPWQLVSLLVGGMVLTSWLIHRFVERPASRALKRFLENRPTRP